MSIRSRIFGVIGGVVVAAFLQTFVVIYLEGQRTKMTADLDRTLLQFENHNRLTRLVTELESAHRGYLLSGAPESRIEFEQLWSVYERTVTLLPQYVDDRDVQRRLRELDALVRDWHDTVAVPLIEAGREASDLAGTLLRESLPRMRAIRNDLDRLDIVVRDRLTNERQQASTQYLRITLVTLAIPALAIVMLLVLVAILARILLDPLAAVAQSARLISGGDFDVTLPEPRRDEIGALVRAFEDMSSAVQRRQRDLTDALSREREVSTMYATLRSKAEHEHARLLATISTVPAALVIYDAATGRIVLQNKAAESLIGQEPEDEAARQEHWQRYVATYRDGTACPREDWGPGRALRGEVVVGQELIVNHPDGRMIPILVSAAPLVNDQQQITGAVAAFQDITKLHEVDRLKSEFVSVVSHELRTPLTSIKGALQLLLDEIELPDPDHATLMGVALSNTDRLIRIINDILDISKIEAGKLELKVKVHEPKDLVRQSVESVAPIAEANGVALEPVVPADLPSVLVDSDRTIQAMVNLLSNALKYAPPKTAVTLEGSKLDDGFVQFAVIDHGPGIPPDKLDLLFQKFQQVDGPDTRRFRGTGLGLAITKALIEMQGGEVGVRSELGRGSVFTITVPVADAPVCPPS
ncbi:MAG: ATP-binding protein [Acidobacteriota bacterium]